MTPDQVRARLRAIWPLVARARRDVSGVKTADGPRWTNRQLDLDALLAHVSGGQARGVCYIKEEESVTSVAVVDLDSHRGETPFADMVECARRICEAMVSRGMKPRVWVSSGGHGIHIYVLWQVPQDAYTVRETIRELLGTLHLTDGGGGVAKGQVEVFPRQDHIGVGQKGNMTILPFAGKSGPLDLALGIPLPADDAVGMEWPVSEPLAFRVKPDRSNVEVAESVEFSVVRNALMSIPNDGVDPKCPQNYDEWRNFGFAVHDATNGSDEGLELFNEWSAKNPKYDKKFTEDGFWKYIRRRAGGIGIGTLLMKARECGYTSATADGFVDVPEALTTSLPEVRNPAHAFQVTGAKKAQPPYSRSKDGTILATLGNVLMAVRKPEVVIWRIAYDAFRDEIVVFERGSGACRALIDADYTRLREYLPSIGFAEVGKELVRDALMLVAQENKIDSAQIWLNEVVPAWDGTPRINTFFERYFSVMPGEFVKAVGSYVWTAMAGRVLDPGCQADMAPILVGAQGERKTSALAAMVPTSEHCIEVDFNSREDDLARMMRGVMLGEIGELRGFNKKELAGIKAFMTRRVEKWVPKFKEFTQQYPRRLVFIGTTNEDRFLQDSTGNRRWLPLNVGKVDVEGIREAMPQLWAEARETFRRAGVAWQEAERLARDVHEEFEIVDPWIETVSNWLDSPDVEPGCSVRSRPYITTEMVLTETMRLEPGRQTRSHQMHAGEVLRKLGATKGKKRTAKGFKWVFTFPPVPAP